MPKSFEDQAIALNLRSYSPMIAKTELLDLARRADRLIAAQRELLKVYDEHTDLENLRFLDRFGADELRQKIKELEE